MNQKEGLQRLFESQNFLYRFLEIVKKDPDNIAVLEDGNIATTYLELYQKSLKIAQYLVKNCNNQRVGISLEKSSEYIIALLGCWFAKKAFVPVDNNLPQSRKDFIFQDASLDFIISEENYNEFIENNSDTNLDFGLAFDYPAYVIYTSGTTGAPKGVLVSHNGIVNLADNQIKAFEVDSDSRYLFYLSTNFDASISDISVCLLSGATLVIEKDKPVSVATNITELTHSRQLTHMDIPPSLLKLLSPDRISESLKTIIIGGEACDIKTVKKWAKKVNLINVYGPTEATVCTSLCKCDESWSEALIGDEIENIHYEIFDTNKTSCVKTQRGELYISGIGLALEYVNNPELTAKKFVVINDKRFYRTGDLVERLSNGKIKFIGRIDRQVKIRGQLVELEEIETKLKSYVSVANAIALKRPLYEGGSENLVAFVEVIEKITSDELKDYLRLFLPVWMIPSHIEIMENLPLSANGKIDSDSLISYQILSSQYSSGIKTPVERIIVELFEEIIKIKNISVDDSFFDIGGDSLNVLEFIFKCEDFGIPVTADLLLEYQTPRLIAQHLKGNFSTKMSTKELSDFEYNLPSPYSDNKEVSNVFITGCTGFLGSSLLKQLLEATSFDFYCLIRAEDEKVGLLRLKKTFDDYALDWNEYYADRIHVVCGDIGLDKFGLKDDCYEKLSHSIDVVYHCAALVNMVYPYKKLKRINTDSVAKIVEFCCSGRKKPLHYASTLSVFVSTDQNTGIVYESDRLDNINYVYGGYGQSKFAAEKYLLGLSSDICDVYIYRFGLITGNSNNGISAKNDFLGMFIRGAEELKVMPIDNSDSLEIDITPIDYAASAMALVSLSFTEDRVFHIANSKALKYNDLINIMKSQNRINEIVSYSEWIESIQSQKLSLPEQACIMALCRLDEKDFEEKRFMDLFQATGIKFDTTNTNKILKTPCPEVTNDLIIKYIDGDIQKVL